MYDCAFAIQHTWCVCETDQLDTHIHKGRAVSTHYIGICCLFFGGEGWGVENSQGKE